MRKMFFTVTASMLFVLSFATLALAQSIDGNWDVKIVSPQGERTAPISLKQSGETVTGKMGPYDVTGTIKGSAVTLKYTVKFQDNDLPITMTGTLNGDAMGGKADFGGFAEGEWSGKKSNGAAAAPAAPAAASSASASAAVWDLMYTSPVGEFPVKLTVTQDGEKLSGTAEMGGPNPQKVPFTGTLKGDAIELKIVIKYEGNDLPITSKGKVTGGEVKGMADYGGLAEGEFKGKKN
jgi:hypothetical protein